MFIGCGAVQEATRVVRGGAERAGPARVGIRGENRGPRPETKKSILVGFDPDRPGLTGPALIGSDWHGFDSDRDLIVLVPDRKKHGSCAELGSAPDLLGSGFGERIEAHDLVVRINYATSTGKKSYCFRGKRERSEGFYMQHGAIIWS